MKRIITLIAVLGTAAPLLAGDLTGKVTFKGTPPPEKEIEMGKSDPKCGALHTEKVTTQWYKVGPAGEFADVIVTLKGISGKSEGATAAPLVIVQKGCAYEPLYSVAQTGQKIIVKNADPTMHNVSTIRDNAAAGNKQENHVQMANAGDLNFSFPAAESFLRFKCDVHPWMFSYVTVVDHPYVAVSGKDGTFVIKNAPAGKYTVEATHRKAGTVSQEVEITDAGGKADFTLEAK